MADTQSSPEPPDTTREDIRARAQELADAAPPMSDERKQQLRALFRNPRKTRRTA